MSPREFRNVSVEKVLHHPRWKMGKKITVDSAGLINKGLEVIEAHVLFGIPLDKIKILIHPEAVIHGIVETIDSTMFAVAGVTDMRLPLLYALTYPERKQAHFLKLDLLKVKTLTFKRPNVTKFPGLKLALEIARRGQTYPCVFNAANEICVEEFIRRNIRFTDIVSVIRKVVSKHVPLEGKSIGDIINADKWARNKTREIIAQMRKKGR